MIEDDTCKKQLSRLYDKVRSIKDTESFQGPKVIIERSGVSFTLINMTRGKQYLDLFPEEVCCKVLETFKSAQENKWIDVQGIPEEYSAHVVKKKIKSYETNNIKYRGPIAGSKIFMQKGISKPFDEGLFSIDLGIKYKSGPRDKIFEVATNYLNEVFSL